jgi:mono/diheme cytochrome c family protein
MAQRISLRTTAAALAVCASALLTCRILIRPVAAMQQRPTMGTIPSHATRNAPDDLEITGLPGYPDLYLRASDLATLPLVTPTIQGDPNFPGQTLHITGVYLDQLARALGAPTSLDLIDALCSDNYRSHYPADYIAQHHPILVFRVDGLAPAAWAAKTKQDDPGPYFITYEHFVPAFRILAHDDEAQLPTNVIRLNLSTTAKTFGAITPPGHYPADSPVAQGFAIAKQDCLRCHFMGTYGGTKSGLDWTALSAKARQDPARFAKYIRDPKSVDPHAQMPASPGYDEATTAALTAYFRAFPRSTPR